MKLSKCSEKCNIFLNYGLFDIGKVAVILTYYTILSTKTLTILKQNKTECLRMPPQLNTSLIEKLKKFYGFDHSSDPNLLKPSDCSCSFSDLLAERDFIVLFYIFSSSEESACY